MGHCCPVNAFCCHNWSLDTDASKVEFAMILTYRCDATEACTEAAGHVIFERDIAGDAVIRNEPREGGEHCGRPTADDLRRSLAGGQTTGQQVGDKAVMASRSVVGRELDVDTSLPEVFDTRQERRGSHAVKQSDR